MKTKKVSSFSHFKELKKLKALPQEKEDKECWAQPSMEEFINSIRELGNMRQSG